MLRSFFITFSAVILGACAHTPRLTEAVPPLSPLSPDSFGGSVSLVQSARIQIEGEITELLMVAEIDSRHIAIAGLLPNGTRIFTLGYDGENLSSEGGFDPGAVIQADYMLADFQLALWPLVLLQEHFAAHSECFASGACRLVETNRGLQREVTAYGNPEVTITYSTLPRTSGTLVIDHQSRGYTIEITTLEETRL